MLHLQRTSNVLFEERTSHCTSVPHVAGGMVFRLTPLRLRQQGQHPEGVITLLEGERLCFKLDIAIALPDGIFCMLPFFRRQG